MIFYFGERIHTACDYPQTGKAGQFQSGMSKPAACSTQHVSPHKTRTTIVQLWKTCFFLDPSSYPIGSFDF
jgi:hypothetical protein